jgi:hypothetical protein
MDAGGGGDPSAGSNMGVRDGQGRREWWRPRHSDHMQGHLDLNAHRGGLVMRDASSRARRAHRTGSRAPCNGKQWAPPPQRSLPPLATPATSGH